MRVEKVTIGYSEKRSARYQTSEHSIVLEVSLSEGETINSALDKYEAAIIKRVTETTAREIDRLAEEAGR